MFKFWSSIHKDFKILTTDKVGLTFMFAMPILLVIIITNIQNSTYEIINNKNISLIINNKDNQPHSLELEKAFEKMGMFNIHKATAAAISNQQLIKLMHKENALLAIEIPSNFTNQLTLKAKNISERALNDFGLGDNSSDTSVSAAQTINLFFNPVLSESFRYSINGAIKSALQLVESKVILETLYLSLNENGEVKTMENDLLKNQTSISEIPLSFDGNKTPPNATQHNIPAWTIFAMFFIVISLGSNVVREKLSGSFIRLKTLPTSYLVSICSKQITYLLVCLIQVFVIFSIGIWLFPVLGLPKLMLPADLLGLFVISLVCGICAINYAICIGVFAESQEQANGFGAVSIVILAAIGGIMVPSFAMPGSFHLLMKLSPLHWCLESYNVLFLEGGKLADAITTLLPLIFITIFLEMLIILRLKRKNLI